MLGRATATARDFQAQTMTRLMSALGTMGVVPDADFLEAMQKQVEREFFIDNLLVGIHYMNVMIRWTGLAPWGFEFPFPDSLTSTFIERRTLIPTTSA